MAGGNLGGGRASKEFPHPILYKSELRLPLHSPDYLTFHEGVDGIELFNYHLAPLGGERI